MSKKILSFLVVFSMLLTIMPAISNFDIYSDTVSAAAPVTPEPGNAPEPFYQPTGMNHNAPVIPMADGNSFTLFPTDWDGLSVENSSVEGLSNIMQPHSSGMYYIGKSIIYNEDGVTTATGPYNLYDAVDMYNNGYGTTDVYVGDGGNITHSTYSGNAGEHMYAIVKNTKFVFTPKSDILNGVKTRISTHWYHNNSGTPLTATVVYEGGTDTILMERNTVEKKNNEEKKYDYIVFGDYISVQSVSIEGTGNIPPVMFTVVNDDPNNKPDPQLPGRDYEKPDIQTVTPEPPSNLKIEVPETGLWVNEVCASNTDGHTVDGGGSKSDWIEIYNSGDFEINLSGYGLADKMKDIGKHWRFPENTKIDSKSFLVIYANGKTSSTSNGKLQANFSLGKSGERVILLDGQNKVISFLDFPDLADNQTFARYPDGSADIRFSDPSPGLSNIDGEIYVPKPVFSHQAGVYASSFDLTIEPEDGLSGAVHYSMDGTDPTIDSPILSNIIEAKDRTSQPNIFSMVKYPNSFLAANPATVVVPSVNIKKATIVKAIFIDSNGNSSDIVTKTYIIGDMADDFNNMPVLSIQSDFSNFVGNGWQQDEYDDWGIWTDITDNGEADQTDIKNGREWERPVYLELFETNGERVLNQAAGARVRGMYSSQQHQKGLNFYARKDYGGPGKFKYPNLFGRPVYSAIADENGNYKQIEEFDNFCIRTGSRRQNGQRYNDISLMTAGIGFGEQGQTGRNAIVFINGEYWGFYFLQERASDSFIEEHYGVPADDVIFFKNNDRFNEMDPEEKGDFNKSNFLTKTDFNDIDNYKLLDGRYDLESAMRYLAVNMLAYNADWGGFNIIVWRSRTINPANPYQDGKWRFLLYDLDECFLALNQINRFKNVGNSHIATALKSNPSSKRRFVNAVLDAMNTSFDAQRLYREMKYYHSEYSYDIPDIIGRWPNLTFGGIGGGGTTAFGITSASEGYSTMALRSMFEIPGQLTHLNVKTTDESGGKVKINTYTHDFVNGNFSGNYFTDYTITVTALPNPGYRFDGWTVTDGTGITSTIDATAWVSLAKNGSQVTANFVDVNAPPKANPDIVLNVTGDSATASFTLGNGNIQSGTLILAAYENGGLTDIDICSDSTATETLLTTQLTGLTSGSKVKAFVWDGLDIIQPFATMESD